MALLVIAPGPAYAAHTSYPSSAQINANKTAIAQWATQGTSNPSTCGSVCQTMVQSGQAPPRESAQWARFTRAQSQKQTLFQRAKDVAGKAIRKPFGGLGTFGAAVTTFQVGWWIGKGIGNAWETRDVPAVENPTDVSFNPVGYGDEMIGKGCTGSKDPPGTGLHFEIHAPSNGFSIAAWDTVSGGSKPPDSKLPPAGSYMDLVLPSCRLVVHPTLGCCVSEVTGELHAIFVDLTTRDFNFGTGSMPSGTKTLFGNNLANNGPWDIPSLGNSMATELNGPDSEQKYGDLAEMWAQDHVFPPVQVRADHCQTQAMTYAACVDYLREQGWTGTASRAVEPFETVNLDRAPDIITRPIRTTPYSPDSVPGEFIDVETDTPIEFPSNPPPPDYPVEIPPPTTEDDIPDWRRKLKEKGLWAVPITLPLWLPLLGRDDDDGGNYDPGKGPNQPLWNPPGPLVPELPPETVDPPVPDTLKPRDPQTVPRPIWRDPATGERGSPRPGPDGSYWAPPETDIWIPTNPPNAPPATPGGGAPPPGTPPGCDPWLQPSINLSALNVPIGDVFPFALFPWLLSMLNEWDVAGGAPRIVVPFVHGELVFDMGHFEPAMVVVRPVIVVVSFLSMVWLVASAAMGLGAPQNDD